MRLNKERKNKREGSFHADEPRKSALRFTESLKTNSSKSKKKVQGSSATDKGKVPKSSVSCHGNEAASSSKIQTPIEITIPKVGHTKIRSECRYFFKLKVCLKECLVSLSEIN